MSINALVSSRSDLRRLVLHALSILLLLGIAVGGLAVWQQVRSAPAQRHVDEGKRLLKNGQNIAAEMQWREAVRLDPGNADAWGLLGDFYSNTRNYPAALEAYNRVLKLDESRPGLQARMAMCALAVQDFSSARSYAKRQLEQNPDDITALETLAAVEKQENNSDAQVNYLWRLAELRPDDARALTTLANALAARNEYDKLLPVAEKLVPLAPKVARSYLLRGIALFALNSDAQALSRAEADFQKAADLDPNGVLVHRYLARLYMRRNQPLRAIEHYETISRKWPFASAHFLELSRAYRRAGSTRRADELQTRFLYIKQLNSRMLRLKNRILVSPNAFESYLQLGLLFLQSLESSEGDYQLDLFGTSKEQLKSVDYYIDRAAQMRPGDARVKAAQVRLEASYERHLRAALQAAARRDSRQAGWHMSRVSLLRPNDPRTRDAARQLAAANAAVR